MRSMFVITGDPGSGKTQLLGALGEMGFQTVPEPARVVIAEQRANGVERVYHRDPRPTDEDRGMTLAFARAFGDRVREVYVGLGYEVVDVPRAAPEERAAFVVDALRLR